MYYLFRKPDQDRYIQLTFTPKGIVDTHTDWTRTPSVDFLRRDPDDSWSVRDEWLSTSFEFPLIAKSTSPITSKSHPELFI